MKLRSENTAVVFYQLCFRSLLMKTESICRSVLSGRWLQTRSQSSWVSYWVLAFILSTSGSHKRSDFARARSV